MIRSMTGYGRAKREIGGRNILVEIKSVNNRYLDCSVKVPKIFGFLEDKVKSYLSAKGISRGKLEVYVSIDILEEIGGKQYTDEEKVAYATWKNDYYRELLGEMSPKDLSSEVKSTLDELRARGYLLTIGSSSKNTKYILQRLGLEGYFDAISDGTNIVHSKPDPEVFLKSADFVSMPYEACLVVEDAISGVEAAHAAGMKAAVVGDAAENHVGDYILESFSDLLKLLPGVK